MSKLSDFCSQDPQLLTLATAMSALPPKSDNGLQGCSRPIQVAQQGRSDCLELAGAVIRLWEKEVSPALLGLFGKHEYKRSEKADEGFTSYFKNAGSIP